MYNQYRWYDIVTNDISKMKRLTLTICGDLSRKDHLTLGNWKFYKVVFKSINKSLNKDMLSKLTTIGAYVHEIEFIECSVHDPKVFQNILRNFLKVEKLTFLECMFRNHLKISDTDVLELENLKELVFKQHSLMVNYDFKLNNKLYSYFYL